MWILAIVLTLLMCTALMSSVETEAAVVVVNEQNACADDENPGTAGRPLRTIGAALEGVRPGDTVVIHEGTYREHVHVTSSGEAGRPITIAAAEGQAVIINGADPVTGWEKADGFGDKPIWVKKPWKQWSSYGENVSDKNAKPQLIIDRMMLTHVASTHELIPGSFCYDRSNDGVIFLWPYPPRSGEQKCPEGSEWWDSPVNLASSDPNDHQVEAAVRHKGISLADGVHHVVLKGLCVRYGSGGYPAGQAIEIGPENGWVSDILLEDSVSEYHCGGALCARGQNITIRRCSFRHTGISSGAIMVDSLIEDCVFDGNSNRGVSHGWSAGAIKLLMTVRTTIRRNQFINNDGPGLWFDWGNSDNVVEQNFCAFNYGPGIMMEVSPHFESSDVDAKMVMDTSPRERLGLAPGHEAGANVIRNNVCANNRWDGTIGAGILLQMASNCVVANNTCVGNEQYGIFVRYHPYDGANHRCVNNTIVNNLCADNGGSQIYITPDPADKPGYVSRNVCDHNLLFSSKAWRRPGHLSGMIRPSWPDRANHSKWGKSQGDGTYSVEEWSKIRGFDAHSIQWEPMFISASTLDFRLRRDSPAIAAGTITPHVTDDYRGRPRAKDASPCIGALEYTPEAQTPPRAPMR